VVNRPTGQLVLFDTPGIHKPMHEMNRRMVAAACASLEHVELACWLVDITQPYGPGDRYVRDVLKKSGRKVMLGINKIDALPKPRILPAIEQYRTLLDFVEIVPLSAKNGDNVELLAERMLAQLPPGQPLYPEDFLTDRPERFFVAEMIREQVLALTREELPYSTGVVIESFQEEAELVRIQAALLVERDSQKAILIGKGGLMAKAIGSAARREIESFLGAKVFLGLFVKVREGWREDERALDEVGLERSR
jgi:GTP-binding protein Era